MKMKPILRLARGPACVCIAAVVVCGCVRVGEPEHSSAGVSLALPVRRSILIAQAVQKLDNASDGDVLQLTNGQVRSGAVLNETFTVKTEYGRIILAASVLRGLFDTPDTPDTPAASGKTLVTTGENWFSGGLQDKQVLLRRPDGTTDTIPAGEVRQLIFPKRPKAAASSITPGGRIVEMANGDIFHGRLLDKTVLIGLTNSDVTVDLADVDRLEMADGLARARMRASGDVLLGVLKTSGLRVALGMGGEVTINPARIAALHSDSGTVPLPVMLARGAVLAVQLGNGVTMKLVLIPAWKFTMGSDTGSRDEKPVHQVTIGTPFYMGVTEVTQAQWRAVMNIEPWKGKQVKARDDHAAGWIGWDDATAFCAALSTKTGHTVRLPTEAEWEYACRAGTTTMYSFGDDASELGDYAWYSANAYAKDEKYAHPVGAKKPNAFGLYDMHGNVYEWCGDRYADSYANADARDPKGPATGEYRVLRGGSWQSIPFVCRSAYRTRYAPGFRYKDRGFRVVVESRSGAD